MIDSGNTMIGAIDLIKKMGALKVYAYATHGNI